MTFNAGIEAAALNMTTRDDLVSKLRRDRIVDARLGFTCQATKLELEAASALEAKDAEIATQSEEATTYHKFWIEDRDKRIEAESRITDLERQLAELKTKGPTQ